MVQTFPNIDPDSMFELISDNEQRIKWEVRYCNVNIVEKQDDGMMVIYGEMAPIPPPFDKVIWPRNFILKGISVKDGCGEGRHINIG